MSDFSSAPMPFQEIIGNSVQMQAVYETIVKASQCKEPVLIVGETGTGKELVARAVSKLAGNGREPFTVIDCASLAPGLVETELFGHTRGAFTGALSATRGLFEDADSGTAFLDEIGELSIDMQCKLLRAVQEHQIRPVGSTRTVQYNARLIAATNRDLEVAIREGTFRKDLYYRLNVLRICLPPLRERIEDIPLLAKYFIVKHSGGQEQIHLSEDALQAIANYDWPGNVRELENCIRRALIARSSSIIQLADVALPINASPVAFWVDRRQMSCSIREWERQAILHALARANGDKKDAARRLGIGKTTIYRKLKEYHAGASINQEIDNRRIQRARLLPQIQKLSAGLFSTRVGVAIFDNKLRYETINNGLIELTGIPAQARLGKRPGQVLGYMGEKIESELSHVIHCSHDVVIKLSGYLPGNKAKRDWLVDLFPTCNAETRVKQIVALVIDTTKVLFCLIAFIVAE